MEGILPELCEERIVDLKKAFLEHANSEKAAWEIAYMKNRYSFFGIPKKLLRELIAIWVAEHPITTSEELKALIQRLYQLEEREFHYTAIEIARKYSQYYDESFFDLFEMMVRNHSWWDSVDEIAAHLVGTLIEKYPEKLERKMDDWIDDPYMWIRRTAVLYQIRYKDATDQKRLFRYCEKLFHEKEFFIRKVIGWSLREYAKTSPKAIIKFVESNQDKMSGLSKREALKHL